MAQALQWRFVVRGGESGFRGAVTADKNMRYQQNLLNRNIAIVVLGTAQLTPVLRLHVESIKAAINRAEPGSYIEVQIARE